MSENTEEITLRLLRETRAELIARFDGLDHRLHRIEQRLGVPPAGRIGSATMADRDRPRAEK